MFPDKTSSENEVSIEGFLKRLGRDIVHYLPAALVPAGLGVASVAIFTRVFDPGEYGQYTLVTAAAVMLIMLFGGWIQQAVLRYLPKYKAEGRLQEFRHRLKAVLGITLLFTLAVSMIVFPFVRGILGDYNRFFFPGVLLILAGICFEGLIAVFPAELKPGKFAKYRTALAVGKLSLALCFVFLISRDVIGLILGAAAAQVILIVWIFAELGLGKAADRTSRPFDIDFLKEFMSYGFPMIGWLMGGQILGVSDRFFIGAFWGAEDVGIYSANYNLVSMGIGLASSPILMAAHPLIINAWERGDRTRITEVISAFSRYFFIAIVPIIFFVGVFSREIVQVLIGEEFQEGYIIIPLVLMGYSVWGLAMYGHKGLEIAKKTKIMLLLVGICAVSNMVLNLIFVPRFGYFAAAVTTFVSYLLYPVLIYWISKTNIPWRIPWGTAGKVVSAAVLVSAGLYYLKNLLALKVGPVSIVAVCGGIALPVYLMLLWILKELRRNPD